MYSPRGASVRVILCCVLRRCFASLRFVGLSFVAPGRTLLLLASRFVVLLLGKRKPRGRRKKLATFLTLFFGGELVKLLFVVGFDVAFGRRT